MKKVRSTLIIDDNPADSYFCQLMFEPSGLYEHFATVATGSEAIQLFEDPLQAREALGVEFPPDLVLLDINMPGIDGFEFLRRFRALPEENQGKGVVIVMLTSSSDPRDRELAAELGVEHFVIKPPTEDDARRLAELAGV